MLFYLTGMTLTGMILLRRKALKLSPALLLVTVLQISSSSA